MVCYACFNKAVRSYNITGKIKQRLKTISSSFDENNASMPSVLCGTCYIKLTKNILTTIFDYTKVKILPSRYGIANKTCACQICQVARFRGHPKVKDLPFSFASKKKNCR